MPQHVELAEHQHNVYRSLSQLSPGPNRLLQLLVVGSDIEIMNAHMVCCRFSVPSVL